MLSYFVRFFNWIDQTLTKWVHQQKFNPDLSSHVWIVSLIIYFLLAYLLVPPLAKYHDLFKIIGHSILLLLINLFYLFYYLYYQKNISQFGFNVPNLKKFGKSILLAFFIPHAFLILTAIIISLIAWLSLPTENNPYHFTFQSFTDDWSNGSIVLAQFLILAPIAEEIFFRGFVYSSMRKKLGIFMGGYLSALIFSFAHVTMPVDELFNNITTLSIGIPIGPFLLGWFNAYIYERSGCIWIPIIIHSALNLSGPLVHTFCPFMLNFLQILYL